MCNWPLRILRADIRAKVLQNSYLSNNINKGRRCSQGDSTSPYLFVLAAQILTMILTQNSEIKSTTINGIEF